MTGYWPRWWCIFCGLPWQSGETWTCSRSWQSENAWACSQCIDLIDVRLNVIYRKPQSMPEERPRR